MNWKLAAAWTWLVVFAVGLNAAATVFGWNPMGHDKTPVPFMVVLAAIALDGAVLLHLTVQAMRVVTKERRDE